VQYIKLNEGELNKQRKLSPSQKNVIKSLVSSINNGYQVALENRSGTFQADLERDINKLNQALRLYGIQHVIEINGDDDEIEEERPLGCSSQNSNPELVDYASVGDFYGGKVPLSDIDSNKWFYDADSVEWVGYPKDKEYNDCSPEEIVKVSRYSMPDWEIYVPLEYQRTKDYQTQKKQYIPIQVPMGVKDNNKVRFTPRVGRSVGRVLQ
jgi:hypothetical protein